MHSDFRVYDLQEQEWMLKQGNLTIASYSARLNAIWRDLDLIWPTRDKQSPSYVREIKFRTLQFLMGLNSEYEILRSQLLHWERFPTLVEAILDLQGGKEQEEIKYKGRRKFHSYLSCPPCKKGRAPEQSKLSYCSTILGF